MIIVSNLATIFGITIAHQRANTWEKSSYVTEYIFRNEIFISIFAYLTPILLFLALTIAHASHL